MRLALPASKVCFTAVLLETKCVRFIVLGARGEDVPNARMPAWGYIQACVGFNKSASFVISASSVPFH